MFLLDLRPKIAHDRIYCHVLDFANDLHALNDPNCDVVRMLHPVLVLPLNKHSKIVINSYSKAIDITPFSLIDSLSIRISMKCCYQNNCQPNNSEFSCSMRLIGNLKSNQKYYSVDGILSYSFGNNKLTDFKIEY